MTQWACTTFSWCSRLQALCMLNKSCASRASQNASSAGPIHPGQVQCSHTNASGTGPMQSYVPRSGPASWCVPMQPRTECIWWSTDAGWVNHLVIYYRSTSDASQLHSALACLFELCTLKVTHNSSIESSLSLFFLFIGQISPMQTHNIQCNMQIVYDNNGLFIDMPMIPI